MGGNFFGWQFYKGKFCSGKLPSGKFPDNKLPPGKMPPKSYHPENCQNSLRKSWLMIRYKVRKNPIIAGIALFEKIMHLKVFLNGPISSDLASKIMSYIFKGSIRDF